MYQQKANKVTIKFQISNNGIIFRTAGGDGLTAQCHNVT